MNIKIHANARLTPKMRQYVHDSSKSVKELSKELGVTSPTIRKWKKRTDFFDRSHTRKNLRQSMSPIEEEIIVELRERLALSFSDITEVMNRCVRSSKDSKLSKSAIHRCAKRRNAVKGRLIPSTTKERITQPFKPEPFGFVHIDLKHLSRLQSKPAYVFVAIERNTRYVWVEIIDNKRPETTSKALEKFLKKCHFSNEVHTILTDNGSEFTDRYKYGESRKPTGNHLFDKVCSKHQIEHRLTPPYSPQTNGMVERFNRRLNAAFSKVPINNLYNSRNNHFANHEERNNYILKFVYDYNRTRLQCLDYKAPIQMVNNHTGLYTNGGELENSLFIMICQL